MKHLKVSMKLLLSFSLVIVLTVVLVEMGLWGMERIRNASDDMYMYNVNAVDAIGLIRENFANQRYTTRELIIYDSATEEYQAVKASLQALEADMEEYMTLYSLTMRTEEDFVLFERFQNAYYDVYGPYKESFIKLTDQNQVGAVLSQIQTQGADIVDNMAEILQEAHDFNAEAAKAALQRNESLYAAMRNIELVILLAVVIFVILLIFHLRNLISKPLTSIANALGYMGSTGDLKLDDETLAYTKTTSVRRDEIGKASLAIINLLRHIWGIENVMTRISGGDFTVEVKSLSDRDTLGLSISKVADNLDRLFQSLKDAEAAALTASKAKSMFLSHISHEIRTPLNAITGMAAVAKNAGNDQAKIAACIEQIMLSSRHLLSILNDVLDMSKIESGKLDLSVEPFRLRTVFDEVGGIIAQSCADKGIHFSTIMDQSEDLTLIGDKLRINQVLINLLGNAVKFTPGGGSITFSILKTGSGKHSVSYRFVIMDSGIGMSGEQIAKLFAPFEQTKAGIAAQFGGTGLGLSISQNLVKMMGGVIAVESALQKGSTFSFTLRFTVSETEADKPAVTAAAADLRGRRLLLVEDVEINRTIIREILSAEGVEIDEAENGKIALELFQNAPLDHYDLIFMDVQMPEMDGYEATGRIRALDRRDAETIPIVAMTANAYKEDVDDALAAGMNAHIAKPIDIDLMMDILARYMTA